MSKTIAVSDDVYERLAQQASARGLAVPEFIAQLVEEVEQARLSAALERMRARGLLLAQAEHPLQTTVAFKPIQVQGKPLSQVILEERR